jgi:hypothetical protein
MKRVFGGRATFTRGLDLVPLVTTFPNASSRRAKNHEVSMTKTEQRRELLSAVLTHLEAATKLLEEAEEGVLADETRELTDKVDVVALAEAA